MRIDILDRDREKGHYDVLIDGGREYAIRGEIGNLFIRYEDGSTLIEHNFRSVEACLIYIFAKLLNRI